MTRPPVPTTRLRLGTYNLHDLRDDRLALVEVLRAMAADVVCVQEVPRHPQGLHVVRRLARAAGLRGPRSHALGGGTTVLVGPRVDVAALRHLPLRVPVAQRRRGLTVLDARVEGAAVRVVGLHLGLHPVQRARHARRVLQLVEEVPAGTGVLVAGDANERTGGPALGLLERELAALGAQVPTYPSDRPVAAIDVILGRGVGAVREVAVPVAADVLARASDHRPRVVDVEIR